MSTADSAAGGLDTHALAAALTELPDETILDLLNRAMAAKSRAAKQASRDAAARRFGDAGAPPGDPTTRPLTGWEQGRVEAERRFGGQK